MAKGYWIAFYRSVSDEAALSRYARAAGTAIEAEGGTILARGKPATTYEAGLAQRVAVVEFENIAAAIAAYQSPRYQEVLKLLEGAAERDIRFMEGV